jgi:hypothetical protein
MRVSKQKKRQWEFSAKNGSNQIVRRLTHTDEYNNGKSKLEEGIGLCKYDFIRKKFVVSSDASCDARLLLFCVGLRTIWYVVHLNFCVGLRRY